MITAKCEMIDNFDKFVRLQAYVEKLRPEFTVFDVETDGLVEKTCRLFGLGFCFNEDYAFYIVWRDKQGNKVWTAQQEKDITNWFYILGSKTKMLGHNALYDILVLESNLGINLTNFLYSDTLLLAHTINENDNLSLKPLGVKYLGPWADKAQQAMLDSVKANGGSTTKENMQMFMAETHLLGEYCCHDVLITLMLFKLFEKKLFEEGLQDLFYKDEIMCLYKEVVIPMKSQGFPVDVSMFNHLNKEIAKDIDKLEEEIQQEIQQYVGKFTKNLLNEEAPIKNKGTFPKVLAEVLNIPMPVTKEGKPTLAKKAVEQVKALNPSNEAFYTWVIEGGPIPKQIDQKALLAAQKAIFFEAHPGKYLFNLNSNDHLSYLLVDCLRYEPLDKTPTGKNKINEEFFDSIKTDDPVVQKLLDYKKLNKIKHTYLEGILDRQVNGIIYTSMLITGTTSGRLASRNPNLNNVPAPIKGNSIVSKYTNAIRKGFIAKSGYKIVGSDFNSLEPHLAAFISGDPGLIDIFTTGKDFYSAIGIKQFNIKDATPYKDGTKDSFPVKYPELRDLVKTYSLAAFYGATGPRISQVTGKSVQESNELLEGYFKAYPNVKKFINKSHYQAKKEGKVKTFLGRTRHLDEAKKLHLIYGEDLNNFKWARNQGLLTERSIYRNLLNNSVNFQVQGLAAHCLNRAMIKMTREFKRLNLDAYPILSIHDEVLVHCKEEIAGQVSQIVKESMENCIDISPIKLKATPIIGNSYGDCK